MGINNFLPMLKDIATPIHFAQRKELSVAVDVMGWLCKGVFSCNAKSLPAHQHQNEDF